MDEIEERERNELDALLAPARELQASESDLARWRRAVGRELARGAPWRSFARLAAALMLGFLFGAGWGERTHPPAHPADTGADATISYVFSKSE